MPSEKGSDWKTKTKMMVKKNNWAIASPVSLNRADWLWIFHNCVQKYVSRILFTISPRAREFYCHKDLGHFQYQSAYEVNIF